MIEILLIGTTALVVAVVFVVFPPLPASSSY